MEKQKKEEKENSERDQDKKNQNKIEISRDTRMEMKWLGAVLILTLILASSPWLIRFSLGNKTLFEEESYFRALVIREMEPILDYEEGIKRGKLFLTDLSKYGLEKRIRVRPTDYFYYLINLLPKVSLEESLKILPVVISILVIFIFYQILKLFELGTKQKFISLLLVITAPIFFRVFCGQQALPVLFGLLGVYFFLRKNNVLSAASFFLLVIHNPSEFIGVCLIFYPFLFWAEKKRRKDFLAIVILILFLAVPYYAFLFNQADSSIFPFINNLNYKNLELSRELLTELGGEFGFSFYYLILVGIGFYYWKRMRLSSLYRSSSKFLIILLVFVFYSLTFEPELNSYLLFVFSPLAAQGLFSIYKRRWSTLNIRNITLFLLLLGILFSTLATIKGLANVLPDEEIKEALEFLGEKKEIEGEGVGKVLSQEKRGLWIAYYGQTEPFFMPRPGYYQQPQMKKELMRAIFYERYLKPTKELLEENQISYIFIDTSMKEDVWIEENQDLLFLLRDEETFEKIYENEKTEIWEVLSS